MIGEKLLFAIIALSLLSVITHLNIVNALEIKGTRTVDGDPSDWIGTPPSEVPGSIVSNGEFIVTDPVNDALPFWRSDWNWPIRSDVDIVEFRLTGDENNLYLLFRFNTMENEWSYYMMVAIDVTPDDPSDGFNSWLPDYADVELGGNYSGQHVSWQWDYIIAINRDWDDDPSRGNSTIGVYDHNWTITPTGTVAFNPTYKVIEASVPWSSIGGLDTYLNSSIRIWIMVFANDYGGVWDPYDNSATDDQGNPCLVGADVYDIAGQTPTYNDTNGEVYDDDGNAGNDNYPTQDHWVDRSFIVTFGSTIPEPIPEPLTIVLVAIVASIATITLLIISNKKYYR